ncbi:hypothetical protein P154DRAFT_529740 [Amniculicola lignicola CBS 123094]|uniref:WW domain-containing protein n=1 Tax=Amniculicola lignicola CBS 123094 TaxID=1392246 RepID=A0A6A5X2W1_9PLEO|nr:hypothetical protein P154DRAFT_529740 [Amniculicola lignicola CBS 123094]
MDFLKKKMKELLDDDKKPVPHDQQHTSQPSSDHGYPPQQQQHDSYTQQPYGQQPSYGGSAAPQGPPAPYGAPPPMPPRWIAQFDQSSQRWYYVEQASGRTQWDLPAHNPPQQGPYAPPGALYGQQQPGQDQRGLFGNAHGGNPHGGYGAPQAYGGHGDPYAGGYGDSHGKDHKEKKGPGMGMVAVAGVGGLAAGGLIGHAMADDSDDEHNVTYVQAAPASAPPAAAPTFQEPPPVPTHDADGDSISSSDRESLESDRQSLIEAQEEYQKEVEDAYDD